MSGDYSTVTTLDASEAEELQRLLDHLQWSTPDQRLDDEELKPIIQTLQDRLDAGLPHLMPLLMYNCACGFSTDDGKEYADHVRVTKPSRGHYTP